MRSQLESLINTLNNNSTTSPSTDLSSTATNANVVNLNTTFNKLMTDLGVATSTSASSGSASTTLRSLLRNMLQHLQQHGSWAASVGHVVHAVA